LGYFFDAFTSIDSISHIQITVNVLQNVTKYS